MSRQLISTKTAEKYLALTDKKRHAWTKSEINGIRKAIHWQKEYAAFLISAINEGNRSITPEQSKFGIEWLRSKIFLKDGKTVRNSKIARCFGDAEIEVVRRFKRFTFEGVRVDQWGYTTPIYRCHAKNGSYFDYTLQFWGLPEVLFTYWKRG